MIHKKSYEELLCHIRREFETNIGNVREEVRENMARIESKLDELIRYTILQRWATLDACSEHPAKKNIRCRICDYDAPSSAYNTVESRCIFNGGVLIRYICPQCGAIFGPSKMLNLTPSELDQEYRIHYSVYKEGDSTDKELRAFHSLNPVPEGKYLIYGCGEWSNTISILRSQGFDVEGFDLYVEPKNHIITDMNVLRQRQYDGIITNNLLEHLTDPVDTMMLFRGLLSGPRALMAHSTPCYEYSFEYTRFHLFFFTGSSVDVICKKCGLKVESVDRDPAIDYINYVFSIQEKDCMNRMHTMHNCRIAGENGAKVIAAYPGGIIYGPYISLLSGSYTLELICGFTGDPYGATLSITKDKGQFIESHALQNGFNAIKFNLDHYTRDVEFVIRNEKLDYFKLKSIVLKR